MKPHDFDAMITSGPTGRRMRVFEPRWWHVRRWVWWLRLPKTVAKGKLTLSVVGGFVVVRCYEDPGIR